MNSKNKILQNDFRQCVASIAHILLHVACHTHTDTHTDTHMHAHTYAGTCPCTSCLQKMGKIHIPHYGLSLPYSLIL